jgi:hypothetical protein
VTHPNEELVRRAFDAFARTMERTGGTFRTERHDVVANDEHAVSLFAARGQREGKTLDVRNVLVTHVRNGKLGETWLFPGDQYASDARSGCLSGVGSGYLRTNHGFSRSMSRPDELASLA